MEGTEIFNFIANVGFPIVIAWYLLTRIETKLDRLIVEVEKAADAAQVAAKAAALAIKFKKQVG